MLPSMKIYTTEEDIKYILFEQSDVISDSIRSTGGWNHANVLISEKILNKQHPGVVVDVGAGFGSFSIPIALKLKDKFQIHSFEPLNPIFLQLCANALLNSIDYLIPHRIGLDSAERVSEHDSLDVNRNANHGSYSFVKELNDLRDIPTSEKKELYEFRRLDSYNLQDVRLIKLSAPGMEVAILEGARKTIIESNCPPIIFEHWDHEWYKETIDLIQQTLQSLKYSHFFSINGYVFAFKSQAQMDYFIEDEGVVDADTGFFESEKVHDTEATLKDQKVYTP